jgi:hypothetical protein
MNDTQPSAIDQAKATLLSALDQLEQAEHDLEGQPDRVDLVVTYSMGRDLGEGEWAEVGGWASTPGPKWLHATLLRRAANAQEEASYAQDEADEE